MLAFQHRPDISRPLAVSALLALAICNATADSLDVGGTQRTYSALVPDHSSRVPLVLVLHGNSQQGRDMRERTAWPDVAQRAHLAVVFPDGLNRSWADLRADEERAGTKPPRGTDDTAFLTALVQHFIDDGTADPKRVYVTGVSNGGAMAMTLACQRAGTFAAAAIVIMSLTETMQDACKPSRPIPILFMNGTADPLVAYEGGRAKSRFAVSHLLSTPDTVRFWREINGCAPDDGASLALPDVDPGDGSSVTRIDSRCPAGRDVVLYRVDGGGHRMPGRKPDARRDAFVTRLLGPQNHDIDGAETIWAFLARFSRP